MWLIHWYTLPFPNIFWTVSDVLPAIMILRLYACPWPCRASISPLCSIHRMSTAEQIMNFRHPPVSEQLRLLLRIDSETTDLLNGLRFKLCPPRAKLGVPYLHTRPCSAIRCAAAFASTRSKFPGFIDARFPIPKS